MKIGITMNVEDDDGFWIENHVEVQVPDELPHKATIEAAQAGAGGLADMVLKELYSIPARRTNHNIAWRTPNAKTSGKSGKRTPQTGRIAAKGVRQQKETVRTRRKK